MSIDKIELRNNFEEREKPTHPILKCGCAAQAVKTMTNGVAHDPIPCCIIHDCVEIADNAPDLTGRIALCAYSGCKSNIRKSTHYGEYGKDGRSFAPSSPDLPFFEHKPDRDTDRYYCGCFGWD